MAQRPELGLLLVPSHGVGAAVALALRAEAGGFDHVWVADERFFRDSFQMLALIARATSKVKVGPCVVDPYTRLPIQIAIAIATLDEISEGRAVLGIGAGASGFNRLGIRRVPPPSTAVADAVRAVRDYLAHPTGPKELPGLDFAPARKSIAVFIAAEGPRMLVVAGQLADATILQAKVSPALFGPARQAVSEAARQADRELPIIVARVDVSVAPRLAAARAALKPRVARRLIASAPDFAVFRTAGLKVPAALATAVADIGYTNDAAQLAEIGRDVPDDWIDHFCIAATPKDLPQHLDHLGQQGATQILVHPVPARGGDYRSVIDALAAWRS